ncbi:radical SAM protein [Geobacter pelophilus]|uniref:Radical SAM protein n=1 Tax=Geoanaerobacter pelophilus TaxID=60036 RepID=A0AAW4KZ48_9BACT|nr:radical SAM protein [Geoanaerobacter pelophilus]MBT0663918.1 radical SAM protein [Geoanaerobacter pelophilus]
MNILVLNLSLRPKSPLMIFPVGLGYIVTAIKNAGFDFDLVDIDAYRYEDVELDALISRKSYDVVCMGCIVTGYKMVKELAAKLRGYHPNIKIIVGNTVASSITETLLSKTEVDIAVIGEGDVTIVDLLTHIKNNGDLGEVPGICLKQGSRLITTPPRALIADISEIPFIDFSIFDIELYINNSKLQLSEGLPIPREKIRMLPINTARGCIANCTFCYHAFKSYPYRYRSVASICEEIEQLVQQYNINFVGFSDELTLFNKKRAIELADTMIEKKLPVIWGVSCRGDLFDSEDDIAIINRMKEAGCISASYSLESADEHILKSMNKHMKVEQFERQTELFHKAGLAVYTSLVFGFPEETPETIKKTFDCCVKCQIYPSGGYLLPQPGSKMYDYAVEHGFIVDEEDYLLSLGDRQDLRLNMTTMQDDELERCVMEGLRECNERLNLGLKDEELIKSTYYRSTNKDAVS